MNKRKIASRKSFSAESLVLGSISIVCGIFVYLLMPLKSFGPDLIQVIDPEEDFLKYALMLFLLLLLGTVAAGTSIVSIVTGIKDLAGIDRGLYIEKGRGIYAAGLILGISGFLLLLGVFILWTVF